MDIVLTKTLKIKNGKLLRLVDDIQEVECLVGLLKKKGYIPKTVIDAKIFSKDENLVEHEIIPYIIHSGEYTESMCYDVVSQALDMAIDLVDDGVYCWDVFPHNFTFHNGKWFLYDFDSVLLSPIKLKSLARGFFKLVFPNYEVLKMLSRTELKEYYLTRYKLSAVLSILPFSKFLTFFFHKTVCSLLLKSKQYKKMIVYLKKLFDVYTKDFKKELYQYRCDDVLFEKINKICSENNVASAFCIGEKSANWAINNEFSNSLVRKFVYFDDYKKCDDFYNLIVSKAFTNISTAVLYPLVDDDNIDKKINYRALYDSYAQQRFYSDCVIYLGGDCSDDFIKNLSIFSSDILILNSENITSDQLDYLENTYLNVEKNGKLIVAKKKRIVFIPKANKVYDDANRGPDAHRQSAEVSKLIKQKNFN